jgi:hypothetical protein
VHPAAKDSCLSWHFVPFVLTAPSTGNKKKCTCDVSKSVLCTWRLTASMVNDADGIIYVKLTVKLVNYAVNRQSLVTVTPLFTIVMYGAMFEWRRMCTTLIQILVMPCQCLTSSKHLWCFESLRQYLKCSRYSRCYDCFARIRLALIPAAPTRAEGIIPDVVCVAPLTWRCNHGIFYGIFYGIFCGTF